VVLFGVLVVPAVPELFGFPVLAEIPELEESESGVVDCAAGGCAGCVYADGAADIGVVAGAWNRPKTVASSPRIAAIIVLSMQTVAAIRCAVLYSIKHAQRFSRRYRGILE
jgi:hypothetical protein